MVMKGHLFFSPVKRDGVSEQRNRENTMSGKTRSQAFRVFTPCNPLSHFYRGVD